MTRRNPVRRLDVAQHEAAHVVVGVAVGLKMRTARLNGGGDSFGDVWFPEAFGVQGALMYAAGAAWEKATPSGYGHEHDLRAIRTLGFRGPALNSLLLAAGDMLAARGPIHRRVTQALLEKDLSGHDIAALARGERLKDEDD
jgi:hypothetical protein